MARSRSRSRHGRRGSGGGSGRPHGRHHESDRRGGGGGQSRHAEPQPRGSGAAPEKPGLSKSGAQKAKEAIEREREKARLKKLEREQTQNEKAVNKEKGKELRREELSGDIAKQLDAVAVAAPRAAAADVEGKAKNLQTAPEKEPVAAPPAPAPKPGAAVAAGKPLDPALVRKLFDLLDRSGKSQVSQRDILVALRKHPQARKLFGLPVAANEDGGQSLEARLLAIQDAFEGGSGLGELNPVWDELRQGSAPNFGREAFSASCRAGSLSANAAAAAALLPREHATGAAFVPTHKWQEVPEGAACPGGLEYKMDMESGRTLARKPPVK
mmetsp:Transcript_36345/g.93698  ORF Transcript_36345/g.93698 Transcript_36345/m.93698 type:complete len:327 (+) Transcript_36345:62-1042(+)